MAAIWTPERIELLKRLWNDGLTASIIARRMGGFEHTSDGGRLSVLGKVNRLVKRGELVGRAPTPAMRRRKRRSATVAPIAQTKLQRPRYLKPRPEPAINSLPDLVVPEDKRRSLLDLEHDSCRWPFGDPRTPGFHFCHHQKIPGSPYCEFHSKRAFVQVMNRQPERVKVFRGAAHWDTKDAEELLGPALVVES